MLTSSYLPGSCSGAEVAALLRLAKTTALLCTTAAQAAVFPESVWDSTTTRWDWLLAMSPDVARCRQMSPDVTGCRRMSPDVAGCRRVSPDVARCRQGWRIRTVGEVDFFRPKNWVILCIQSGDTVDLRYHLISGRCRLLDCVVGMIFAQFYIVGIEVEITMR